MPDDNPIPPPDAPPVTPEPGDGGEVSVVTTEDRRGGSGSGQETPPTDPDPAHPVPTPPGPGDGTGVPPPIPPVVTEPGS